MTSATSGRVINTITSGVLASKALADITTGVRIEGNDFNVNLMIDDSVHVVAGGILFVGGTGTNTLIGPDVAASWSITGGGAGTITAGDMEVSFQGVENLRGGIDADVFNLTSVGFVDETIDGGDGTDTLVGANTSNTFTLTEADAGNLAWSVTSGTSITPYFQTFVQVESLTGGSGVDLFNVVDEGSASGQLDGGGGNDTLTGPNADNTWTLSGSNSGKLNTTDFIGIENLTGGNHDDTFKFSPVGSIGGIHGGSDDGVDALDNPIVAEDTLDYSLYAGPVSVNPATLAANGVLQFATIEKVIGSAASDTLLGPDDAHVAWIITGANAGTVQDTSFEGFENLTGVSGTASDAFRFETAGSISDTISGGTGTAAFRRPFRR